MGTHISFLPLTFKKQYFLSMQRKLQALFSSADIYTPASVLKIVPPFLFELVRLPPAQCCAALLLCNQEEGGELCGPVNGEAALFYVPSWDWQPGGALPGCCSCILSWGPVEHVTIKSHSH